MPASGGKAVQITRHAHGADYPRESPDGRFLYYHLNRPVRNSVWRVPVEGGEETKVLDSVQIPGCWTTGRDGIYFFTGPDKQGRSDLTIYEFATGKARKILTIDGITHARPGVSPDGRTILYSRVDMSGSDLRLVENFK